MRTAGTILGVAGILAFSTIGGAISKTPEAASASKAAMSTASGFYTAAQATEGSRLYAVRCAMCHGQMLEGTMETPALRGKFIANWARSPVGHLYDYVSEAMPQFAPGSSTPAENAAIIAFLLRENDMPAGETPLPEDPAKLKTILFMPVGMAR